MDKIKDSIDSIFSGIILTGMFGGPAVLIYQIYLYIVTGYWHPIPLADSVFWILNCTDPVMASDFIDWFFDGTSYDIIRRALDHVGLGAGLFVAGMGTLLLWSSAEGA